MPYIIRPKGVCRFAATAFGVALLTCAAPAVAAPGPAAPSGPAVSHGPAAPLPGDVAPSDPAAVGCPSSPASTLLAEFGDSALYTLLPSSTFEMGTAGWSLTNASLATGEGVTKGSNAIEIEPGGSAVSPAVCVNSEYPSFRFFYREVEGSDAARLQVRLRWTDRLGFSRSTSVGSLEPNGEWTLSPVLELARALPLWMPESSLSVRLSFEASGHSSWTIDDVYIDPYSR